ncbi:preprotein translocase subunit SecY [bacterium]|nr:MAG: preprotein translocase subunit SecY [bacterium]
MSLSTTFGAAGAGGNGGKGDKSLSLPLNEIFRLAWADSDLRSRLTYVLMMFAVFALGVHIPVPVPGLDASSVAESLKGPAFDMLNMFGGGALKKLSIFALGLNPYITSSIIMQIMQTALPNLKKEMQEGGQYARQKMNRYTRFLSLALCFFQGFGLLQLMRGAPSIAALNVPQLAIILLFWTAGSMFMLWMGEKISENGIGNGTSLMIFAGIILSLPTMVEQLWQGVKDHVVSPFSIVAVLLIFLVATWFIVYFTTAQRRIPIQHMRRMVGTKQVGGSTSYLPLSVNMAGVLPIIFAASLIGIPYQLGLVFGPSSTMGGVFTTIASYLQPNNTAPAIPGVAWLEWLPRGILGSVFYTILIFFFTYFWTAIQYNVEDISDNLKRGGSFIPGVRPGKQTKEFLDSVISRITIVGAAFIAVIALLQYIAPALARIDPRYISSLGGTSLLIMVSVALETMRQIEANLLMKKYGQ